jgi:hypothetical protein
LNPNLTWDIIEDNPNVKWNYDVLSNNPIITWDIVCNNLDKNWKYSNLLRNPNIKWNDALEINDYFMQNFDTLREDYMDEDDTNILHNYFMNPNVMPNIDELIDLVAKKHYIRNFAQNYLMYDRYYHSPQYKRSESKKKHDTIYCELIKKSCTPARLYQWHEYAMELNNWMTSLGFR